MCFCRSALAECMVLVFGQRTHCMHYTEHFTFYKTCVTTHVGCLILLGAQLFYKSVFVLWVKFAVLTQERVPTLYALLSHKRTIN